MSIDNWTSKSSVKTSIHIPFRKLSWHLVWMLALLEALTVPFVVLLFHHSKNSLKNPFHGLIVGFGGVLLLLWIINRMLDMLGFKTNGQRIERISLLPSAFWSGMILALLFILQKYFGSWIVWPYPWKELAIGFLATSGSILAIGWIYILSTDYVPFLSISIWTNRSQYRLHRFSCVWLALLSGFYEAIALPIILIWQSYKDNQVVVSILTGMVGGIAGGAVTVILFNRIKKTLLWIKLDQLDKNIKNCCIYKL